MVNNFNAELQIMYNWFCANKLSVNLDKTKCMLFHSSRQNVVCDSSILINNVVIERVTSIRFLGVIVDGCFRWQEHVRYIGNKISKNIGIIYKVRKKVSRSILILLYNTFIYPFMVYCVEVWGSALTVVVQPVIQ